MEIIVVILILGLIGKLAGNNNRQQQNGKIAKALGDAGRLRGKEMSVDSTTTDAPAEPSHAHDAAPVGMGRNHQSLVDYVAPSGSISEPTYEGIDPCHNEMFSDANIRKLQAQAREAANPGEAQAFHEEQEPAIDLAFNRDSLLTAVVMNEILTRPKDRRRRW